MSEELKDISLNFVRNTIYLKVFPYFCAVNYKKMS
ncbi:hypothetical protein IMSAGC004_00511 [Bacteroidaceae bacterium]|nr:hypothetical protein IMSAGC004_00511 [Bacteroidaceae bacterium]